MSIRTTKRGGRRAGLGLLALLGAVAAFAGLSGSSVAAPQAAPVNTQEPSISGQARVGFQSHPHGCPGARPPC